MLCDIHNLKPEIVYVKNKPKMIKKRRVSVDKAKEELGFSATTTLESGLKLTSNWLSNNIALIYR